MKRSNGNLRHRKSRPVVKKVISAFLGIVSRFLRFLVRVWVRPLAFLINQVNFIRFRWFEFVPRPDDIFIVTHARSGTSWMQMILYQLSTDGSMDIDHISQVSPWFERAAIRGRDLEGFPSPRIIKSHLRYKWIPKGSCKYIYVARDGRDVAVSYYHFYKSHHGFKQSFEKFFDLFIRGKVAYGSWFKHVAEWWSHKDDPNVLCLRYEDLKEDLEGCIRKIIDFCGFEIPPERLPVILERCSFSFMKQHEDKFDFAMEMLLDSGVELHSFIRKGKSGGWKEHLSRDQELLFERKFKKYLGRTGISFDSDTNKPKDDGRVSVDEAERMA